MTFPADGHGFRHQLDPDSDTPSDAAPADPRTPRPPRPPLGQLLRSRRDVVALVALGGGVGSLLRFGVDTALPHGTGSPAWSTLLVNVTGAALLGLLVEALVLVRPTSRRVRPLLGTGLLGGYTTFSAAALDVQGHLAAGRAGAAALAVGLGLVLPVLAAWGGIVLARRLAGRHPTAATA